ncbi:MAG: hypothetical protein VX438_07640 [Planctomycetota bacterium]|nr:hypothetical protein [Planctomycetota bacterium]
MHAKLPGCVHRLWIFVCVFAFSGVHPAWASDEVAKKLLKEFWSHTKQKQTDHFFEGVELKSEHAIYAFALVKSRQHDVARALAAIESLHEIHSSSPQSWRLKTWLLLRQDKFNGAAVSLGKYIEAVKADKTMDDFSRREAYRFAGRVLGFLEGPVESSVNLVTLDALKRRIFLKIDPELMKALQADSANVKATYRNLMESKAKHEENFARIDAQQRKIKFAQLSKLEVQLSKSKDQLNQQSGTVRTAATQELEGIRQQDIPLSSQQAVVESELNSINRELILLINDYNYWNNLALREKDAVQRAYYFQQAGRIDGLIIQQELRVSQIRRELDRIQIERIALRRRLLAAQETASHQLASISKEIKDISKQERRASNEKMRAVKPTRKIITHSVSLKTRAKSIVTYEQFPLEIERQLLLDLLK